MDDLTHDDVELEDIEDEPQDNEVDDAETPKESAEDVKERQKKAWLRKIKDGDKTLDDMPDNLGWLKKEIERDLEEPDDIDSKVQKALRAEREKEDFNLLVEDLEESNIDSEKIAQVKEEYETLIADGVPKLKALIISRRLVGLKDSQTIIAERRRKGMLLPPQGSMRREVVKKDGLTDTERLFMDNLPKQFK